MIFLLFLLIISSEYVCHDMLVYISSLFVLIDFVLTHVISLQSSGSAWK